MMNDLEKNNRERRELYKDPSLETFFATYMSTFKEITPKFDLNDGYKYIDLENALKKNTEEVGHFLEKMVEVKYLDKAFYDVEIRCPHCNSPNISTNYLCPYCKSINIARTFLVDHIPCGNIETIIDFERNKICPKCNKAYDEGSYRIIGAWYKCQECNKQLEAPFAAHFCRDCGERFSFDDATCKNIYSYSPSPIAEKEMKAGILFPSQVRNLLTSLSYDLDNPGRVKGESGIEHKFDFLALKTENKKKGRRKNQSKRERNDKEIAIDILFSLQPIQEFEIMREYGKISDTKVRTYIVAMPELDEAVRKSAKSYRLDVIEAVNNQDAIKKLRKKIQKLK